MRPIIFAVSMLAAACSGSFDSPTSPAVGSSAPAGTQARGGALLPFSGSLTTLDSGVVAPPNLLINGTGEGTATHLGRFTLTLTDVVDLATATGTGTLNLTAANGDQLFTTTAGAEDEFIPPNVSRVTLAATIVGGTGRFAEATGTFTWRRIGIIDFATGTGTSSGTFEGILSLNK